MSRNSLKVQRSKEILDAFERCIFKGGLDNSSLEKIAVESGIKRPALRHFIGNRDELIVALAKSLFNEYSDTQKAMTKLLRKSKRGSEDLIMILLLQTDLTASRRILVLMNLYSVVSRYPKVQKILHAWYVNYIKWVAGRLAEFNPNADKQSINVAATGLVGIAFNYACLSPLNLGDAHLKSALGASRSIVNTIQ